MKNILVVLKKEYLGVVHTKSFVIGTLLTPVMGFVFMFLPSILIQKTKEPQLKLVVIDQTGWMYAKLDSALSRDTLPDGTQAIALSQKAYDPSTLEKDKENLNGRVLSEEISGYLIFPTGVDTGASPEYYAKALGNIMTQGRLERRLNNLVIAHRLESQGFKSQNLSEVLKRADLKALQVSEGGAKEANFLSTYLLSFFFIFVLFQSVLGYGQVLSRSIVEEKNTRIIEVLTSSVTPFQLLMGKILGLGSATLSSIFIWIIMGALLGAPAAKSLSSFGFDLSKTFNPLLMVNFFIYLVLGYLLFTSLFAILGATSNSDQEVQQFVFPIVMTMILPFIIGFAVAQNPSAGWVTILSLIPFFTPTLMMMRISFLPPPAWQLAASYVIMVTSVIIMGWLAAKIFRVGILMYGKRPTLPELVRWVRHR